MRQLRERSLVGLECLEAVTALLQRRRAAHPTAGLFEAADLQWWWSQNERATDDMPQLFWFDGDGRPQAAVIATAFGGGVQLDPMLMPDAGDDLRALVMGRGLANAHLHGHEAVTLEVDSADAALADVLAGHGLVIEEDSVVEAWLTAATRPPISSLPPGYRLCSRAESGHRPHHMISALRQHPDPEPRMRQTSLYRDDLDLVVFDHDGNVAAYGLFWNDPATATGLVEPMRTEADHQQRGLARHVLTTGISLLAAAGASRIKICFDPDNAASKHLYLSVGFQPVLRTVMYAGLTSGPA